jgi:ankyrin repeat protein
MAAAGGEAIQLQAVPASSREGAPGPPPLAVEARATLSQQEKERQQRQALFSAIARDNYDEVRHLIQEEHVNVNAVGEFGNTALHLAFKSGNVDIAELLFEAGADKNARNAELATPLLMAAEEGSMNMIAIVQTEIGFDFNLPNAEGSSPLIAALKTGNAGFALALAHTPEVDVNAQDYKGGTALMYCARDNYLAIARVLLEERHANVAVFSRGNYSALTYAAIGGLDDMVRLLLAHGSEVLLESRTVDGGTPFARAALHGHLSTMELLESAGATIDTRDYRLCTPFLAACKDGQLDVVELLHRQGADINVTDRSGGSALTASAANGRLAITEYLLTKVDEPPTAANSTTNGSLPAVLPALTSAEKLFAAVAYGSEEEVHNAVMVDLVDPNTRNAFDWTALMECAVNGDADIAEVLLNDPRTEVNLTNNEGQSALGLAAEAGCLPLVELLCRKGANVNQVTNMGFTPLISAASGGRTEIVQYLVRWHNADIKVRNYKGISGLDYACISNNKELVTFFLARGADPNSATESSITPLCYACQNKAAAVVDLLLSNKADVATITIAGWSSLCFAISAEDEAMVNTLIQNGAPVNHPNPKAVQPLLVAVDFDNVNIVKLLLAAGASVEARSSSGAPALVAACEERKYAIAEALLDAGAKVDAVDNDGRSPFFVALEKADADLCRLLLAWGCRIDILTNEGWSALMTATHNRWWSCCLDLLKNSHGTDFSVPFPPEDWQGQPILWTNLDEGLADVLSSFLGGWFDTSSREPIEVNRLALRWAVTSPAAAVVAAASLPGVGNGTTTPLMDHDVALTRGLRLGPLRNDAWKRRKHLVIARNAWKHGFGRQRKAPA